MFFKNPIVNMKQRIEKIVLYVGQYIYLGDWISLHELFIKHHSMNVNQNAILACYKFTKDDSANF